MERSGGGAGTRARARARALQCWSFIVGSANRDPTVARRVRRAPCSCWSQLSGESNHGSCNSHGTTPASDVGQVRAPCLARRSRASLLVFGRLMAGIGGGVKDGRELGRRLGWASIGSIHLDRRTQDRGVLVRDGQLKFGVQRHAGNTRVDGQGHNSPVGFSAALACSDRPKRDRWRQGQALLRRSAGYPKPWRTHSANHRRGPAVGRRGCGPES